MIVIIDQTFESVLVPIQNEQHYDIRVSLAKSDFFRRLQKPGRNRSRNFHFTLVNTNEKKKCRHLRDDGLFLLRRKMHEKSASPVGTSLANQNKALLFSLRSNSGT